VTPSKLEAEVESFKTDHLFIVCGNGNSSETTVPNDSMILNNKFERIWKEAAMASFKFLYQYITGETEECHEESWLG
jgi:hypothetical protein